MEQKVGRNDPCPCGSGKKYKQCCFGKPINKPLPFKAKLLSAAPQKEPIDLMSRTFGHMIKEAEKLETPSKEHPESDFESNDKNI